MYGIGRAEAARFERHSRCFELHSRVLRATQQKGARAVSVTKLKFPHFHPYGSGARPDLSFTRYNPDSIGHIVVCEIVTLRTRAAAGAS
jgi:hypothetical protein